MRAVASQKTLMSLITVTMPVAGRYEAEWPNTCVILFCVLHILKETEQEKEKFILFIHL